MDYEQMWDRLASEYSALMERHLDDHDVKPTLVHHFDVKLGRSADDNSLVCVLSLIRDEGQPLRLVFYDTDVSALLNAFADVKDTLQAYRDIPEDDDLLERIKV